MTPYAFDPQLREVVSGLPALDFGSIEATRELLRAARASRGTFEAPSSITVTSHAVQVEGEVSSTVHVFAPVGALNAPAIVWFHGGGFVIGDAMMDAAFNAQVCDELGVVVASVEYSLAPEKQFPTQIDEAYAALVWLSENAATLGVDPARIAVGGQSAGACIAAALALLARDRGGPAIVFQALDIPVVDDSLVSESMRAYDDTPNWTHTSAVIGWAHYLGENGTATEYAAPARATRLAGLPSAFVAVCQFDPLRDEGIEYARRLAAAGVPTELHLYPGTFHGSVVIASAGVSRRMKADFVAALARGLGIESDEAATL